MSDKKMATYPHGRVACWLTLAELAIQPNKFNRSKKNILNTIPIPDFALSWGSLKLPYWGRGSIRAYPLQNQSYRHGP